MGVLEIIMSILVLILVLYTIWTIRVGFKYYNPKHNFFDDLLILTGIPSVFVYIFVVIWNPNNWEKPVYDVFFTPLFWCLLAWMLIGFVIFMIRHNKNRKKDWKEIASRFEGYFLFEKIIIICILYCVVY